MAAPNQKVGVQWGYADGGDLHSGNCNPATVLLKREASNVTVTSSVGGDAFKLMGRQDSTKARAPLARYYTEMGKLIDFNAVDGATGATSVGKESDVPADVEGTVDENGNEIIKLIGVIRSINEPTARGDDLYAPWELELLSTAADPSESAGGAQDAPDAVEKERKLIQLYSKNVARFTGLYVGCVIGVIGTIHRRNADGYVTAVMLKKVAASKKITVPWNLSAHNKGAGNPAIATPSTTSTGGPVNPYARKAEPKTVRVHYISGPFPRSDLLDALKQVATVAANRKADVLVIAGPFYKEFEPEERAAMMNAVDSSFDDLLSAALDAVVEITKSKIKIVIVPSLDDPSAFPVLPQPPFAMAGDDILQFVSNPGEVSVDGIRFGFSSYDVIGEMREKMVERWATMEGSLHRVAETVVNSRLYVPVMDLQTPHHDLSNLDALRIFEDNKNPTKNDNGIEEVQVHRPHSHLVGHAIPTTPPHFLLLASQKPKFAHVTHSAANKELSAPGDGIMVVNPGLMNRRVQNQPFVAAVAEITVTNVDAVLSGGPGVDGVNVRTIRVYDKIRMGEAQL